jgi:hypothetical protein
MEDVDFNVTNKEMIEPAHSEAKVIMFKSKHQTAPGIEGITLEMLQNVGTDLWRRIHSLIKNVWNKEEIPVDWKMGTLGAVCK